MATASADPPKADNAPPPLPPWRETILARYSRKTKFSVLALAALVLAAPWLFTSLSLTTAAKKQPVDTQSADINPEAAAPAAANPSASAAGKAAAPGAPSPVLNAQDDHSIVMAAAPDPGLSEDTPDGTLPRVGDDGRQPWQVYARSFNTADTRPRIAIVIAGLGLSRAITDEAIDRLPANVTLAFDVQSPVVGAWCARARQDGHETLLDLPMEPFDYPRSDPGPNTLLTSLPNADNLARLQWALRQSTGYIGITSLSGSRFTTDPDKLQSVLDALHRRGLMIFDARVAPHSAVTDMAHNDHVPVATATARLDQDLSPEGLAASLDRLEKTARLTGRAVGVADALPVVIEKLQDWMKDLPQQGIALAPVSAMVK